MSRLGRAVCGMGRRISLVGLVAAMAAVVTGWLCGPAMADDWYDFYQFRHSSTLPGNLFGVSPEGQVGFAGALQQNVPVAYTPVRDNWVIGYNSGSNTGSVEMGWGGSEVNGTAFIGMGWGEPGRGIYGSWMATGSDICPAYNLQVQLAAGGQGRPAFAVGVQDILNQREDYVGDPHGARSFYGVATKSIGDLLDGYVSLGWGNGRFNESVFGGVSISLSDTLTLVAEYDGFNTNAGLALSGLDTGEDQDWIAMGYFGYSDLDMPVVGLTVTKH